jgi:mono/diheme cytochrome c family protein
MAASRIGARTTSSSSWHRARRAHHRHVAHGRGRGPFDAAPGRGRSSRHRVYLKDLDDEPRDTRPTREEAVTAMARARLYFDNCAACHRSDGAGVDHIFARLDGSNKVNSDDATTLIRIVLEGRAGQPTERWPHGLAMPAFSWKLTDEQIADVLTYVRTPGATMPRPSTPPKSPICAIGFSLMAANLSGTSYVGLAGAGYGDGIAVWNYEWIAAIVLVFFALFILPYYIRSKVNTLPQFLERRYDGRSKTVFSIFTIVTAVLIDSAGALFAGAITLQLLFPEMPLWTLISIVAVAGGIYVIIGGLKAVMITDTMQGVLLLAAGPSSSSWCSASSAGTGARCRRRRPRTAGRSRRRPTTTSSPGRASSPARSSSASTTGWRTTWSSRRCWPRSRSTTADGRALRRLHAAAAALHPDPAGADGARDLPRPRGPGPDLAGARLRLPADRHPRPDARRPDRGADVDARLGAERLGLARRQRFRQEARAKLPVRSSTSPKAGGATTPPILVATML